jgi:DNA-binding transcriptional LysR family regulator
MKMRHDGSGTEFIPFRYRMDIRQFRYFIAVAEEGHITRAADRLGMQQPPLSRQIRSIEKELGVQLLRRKARGVEMTAAGQALLEEANAIISQVSRATEKVRRTASGEQGRISVGVTPTGPFHPFVPQVIRAFRDAYPLVSVTMEEWASNELVERLRAEQIDVAFIRTLPADASPFAVNPCLEEELIAVLPKGHALDQRGRRADTSLPLKALAGETFLIQGGRSGLSMYADTIAACHAAGFNPRIGQEAPRLASTLNLVAVGLGVSIVPASLERVQMDGLAYRRLRSPVRLVAPLILLSRRGDPAAVVKNFVLLVKHAVRRLQGAHAPRSRAHRSRRP